MTDRSLPRQERLRSFGAIRRLFESGESGFVYPLRYVWIAEADEIPSVEVLFSVPKKFQKRANKRNLQRRRMKEAYRLNKEIFDREGNPVALDLALIYSSKELTPYRVIEHAVQKIMCRFRHYGDSSFEITSVTWKDYYCSLPLRAATRRPVPNTRSKRCASTVP